VIFVFSLQKSNGQIYEHWVKKYKGEDTFHDQGNGVACDNTGNVYVGGSSDSAGGNRFYINKYSPAGALLWTAIYNNTDLAEVIDIAIDNNYGNVAITGRKGHLGGSDIITVKFNFSGVFQWAKIFNGPGNNEDIVRDIAIDGQGNIYVTGSAYYNAADNNNYVTLKYDYNGSLLWSSYYNRQNYYDIAYFLAVDNGGNVFVTGTSGVPNNNPPQADMITVKYNSSGIEQWTNWYWGQSDKDEAGYSLALDNSGNVFVCGFDQDTSYNNPQRPILIKINNAGTTQWNRIFYGESNTTIGTGNGRSIACDNSGNVFVCGDYLSTWTAGIDAMTLKYNSNGDLQWHKLYDYNGNNDYGRKMKLDPTGNPCIAAEINQAVTGYYLVDIVTIKYAAATGTQQWHMTYNRERDYPKDLAIDNSGNVFIVGTIDEHLGWGRANDAVIIKYSPVMVGIHGTTGEIPIEFALSQNYPNPFNPSTKINFSIINSSFVKLAVYDITGKEIDVLVNTNLNAGIYSVDFNAVNYSSGVYFYRLITEGFTSTKKAILTK
jgi:hypothetical protein